MRSRTDWLTATPPGTGLTAHAARFVLGLLLALAGVGHLSFARATFQAQVPPWIPLDPDLVVVVSGVVEIVLGLGLMLLPRWRVPLGWATAAFFVAIFPGNLAQWSEQRDAFGLNSDTSRSIRLLFQPVLVAWALWCSTGWRAWRGRRTPEVS